MSDVTQAAFDAGLQSALDWLDVYKKTDFAEFTEAEARSFFAAFLDTYSLKIAMTWDLHEIKKVGVPARG